MLFMVKVIDVMETSGQEARDDLMANCCHAAHDFWLFEGDEEALHEGITFRVVGEQPIEGYGDLTQSQIKRMLVDVYNIDRLFVY